jgi:preprotein translocase subunit SecB
MRPSPLTLKEYFTKDLRFSTQSLFENTNPSAGTILPDDLKVEVMEGRHEENPLIRNCQIRIELEDPTGSKFPYTFSITLVGFFEVIEGWSFDQLDNLVSANAPALLYSAAREALAMVTGRGPFSKVLLPSVTFVKSLPQSSGQDSNKLPSEEPLLEEGSKKKLLN